MPAETKIQTQAEVDEKMVDLPSEGASVDVEVKDTPKTVNSPPCPSPTPGVHSDSRPLSQ